MTRAVRKSKVGFNTVKGALLVISLWNQHLYLGWHFACRAPLIYYSRSGSQLGFVEQQWLIITTICRLVELSTYRTLGENLMLLILAVINLVYHLDPPLLLVYTVTALIILHSNNSPSREICGNYVVSALSNSPPVATRLYTSICINSTKKFQKYGIDTGSERESWPPFTYPWWQTKPWHLSRAVLLDIMYIRRDGHLPLVNSY